MQIESTDRQSDRMARRRIAGERLPGASLRMSAPPIHGEAATHANAFTVDVEDWPAAVLDTRHDVSPRVVENTRRLLDILRWHNVNATFFVLTRVAERFPQLIAEIHAAGHEIASHGHAHELLTDISPRHFEADVRRSVDILRGIVGQGPIGYRAPAFSIVRSTRWAGPILVELGFRYSSSVFPVRHRRYGIPDAPLGIHRWPDCELVECPPAALDWFGTNWPVAGGGYFRLLPGALARGAISRINRAGRPAVLYMHPYELDVDGIAYHKAHGVNVGWMRHCSQSLFRGRIEERLHRLLSRFRFTTLRDLLASMAPDPPIPSTPTA